MEKRYTWEGWDVDILEASELRRALKQAIDLIESQLEAKVRWSQFQGRVHVTKPETFNGN